MKIKKITKHHRHRRMCTLLVTESLRCLISSKKHYSLVQLLEKHWVTYVTQVSLRTEQGISLWETHPGVLDYGSTTNYTTSV